MINLHFNYTPYHWPLFGVCVCVSKMCSPQMADQRTSQNGFGDRETHHRSSGRIHENQIINAHTWSWPLCWIIWKVVLIRYYFSIHHYWFLCSGGPPKPASIMVDAKLIPDQDDFQLTHNLCAFPLEPIFSKVSVFFTSWINLRHT